MYTVFTHVIILTIFLCLEVQVLFEHFILRFLRYDSSAFFLQLRLALHHLPRWCQSSPRFSWSSGWATRRAERVAVGGKGLENDAEFPGDFYGLLQGGKMPVVLI